MTVTLSGQRPVAMVTGASRGIGRATAIAFAKAGFDLIITARTEYEGQKNDYSVTDVSGHPLSGSLNSTAESVREAGAECVVIKMDLLSMDSVKAAAEMALGSTSRMDVLVNNAIYQGSDINLPFLDIQMSTLDRVAQGYIHAQVYLTQKILVQMIHQKNGRIINITSGAGHRDPPLPAGKGGWGYAYGAGKAAFGRMAGVITTEHGHQGIQAFTLNPGVVSTDTLLATMGGNPELAKRYGSAPPEVPAAVILWLASSPLAIDFQRQMIECQPFALEQKIINW